jgi:flavin-dependent dehydrogenase
MASQRFDAILIGAGPAGCAAARLLAAWGHRILLIDRPEAEMRTLAESIPPSAQRVLAALGMLTSIEDAGFLPWRSNVVWWGDRESRTETFAPGQAGYLVSRRVFDRRLRSLARESGADLRRASVREVTHQESENDPAAVHNVLADHEGEIDTFTAPFVLDCSGRAGVIARRGLREHAASPRTVALVGMWRTDHDWPTVNDTQTLVASYADGWAWSVPTEPGRRHFTVMVEPGRTGLAEGGASDRYMAELAKVPPFRSLVESAQLIEGPWGADASVYTARHYAAGGCLLVGDAGSFIDPLSSFGVKKALVSGWLAAIVVHTALTRPGMRDEALRFFDRRERQIAAGTQKHATTFAAAAAGDTPHPFWLARATDHHDGLELNDEVDPAALARDPTVLAAFEDLRARPVVRLTIDGHARFEPRPMVRGREIVLDEHVVARGCPDGIRYLRDLDLVSLARLAPQHHDVGDLFEAFDRTQASDSAQVRSVPLPDFLGALSALIAWGVLNHAE